MLLVLRSLFGLGASGRLSTAALAQLEDADLMLQFAAGDERAFALLMERHEAPVLRYFLRSTQDRALSEELCQETFLRVVRNADRYQKSAKFSTWLYTIARNLAIDASRRRAAKPTRSLDQPIGDEEGVTFLDRVSDPNARSSVQESERARFRRALHDALHRLPPEQREVFVLRHVEGMRFVEIAAMMGISDNTVKSRMRYALQTLRTQLAAFDALSFDDEEDDDVQAAD